MATAIRVENVSKVYKLYEKPIDRLKESLHPFKKRYHHDFYALRNVKFEVEKGETVGIVGKNGSGKSTLLKIITGVLTPTTGNVLVNGKVSALLELGAGFNPELTGVENVYFNGMIMGFTREEMDEKLDDILSFADIGEFVNQPVKTYSSGMFVRLAFSVATNVNPEILIVDEALSVGDIFFQAKCMAKMRHMIDAGITLLFVTHDIYSVKSLCQKSLWLQDGSLIEFGESEIVTTQYAKEWIKDVNSNDSKTIRSVNGNSDEKDVKPADLSKFDADDFLDPTKHFREGTGAATFKHIEVLDEHNNPLNNLVEYNQEVFIKTYIEFFQDCKNISVGYHIRNKQMEPLIGNDSYSSNTDLYAMNFKKGSHIVVCFKTKVPLIHGIYSINLVISHCEDVLTFSNVVFLDWIENAYIFELKIKKPICLFDYIQLTNEVQYEIF